MKRKCHPRRWAWRPTRAGIPAFRESGFLASSRVIVNGELLVDMANTPKLVYFCSGGDVAILYVEAHSAVVGDEGPHTTSAALRSGELLVSSAIASPYDKLGARALRCARNVEAHTRDIAGLYVLPATSDVY